ncbi:putative toxin-antitoxin system toxin component, PIN family [Burkholderiales bacterium]|nr:putative toxin-antitoxin system toxin component, PIN family [Burkholderiales bacterium]
MKIVLDTNIWLDWIYFNDLRVRPLQVLHSAKSIEILIDELCLNELSTVLSYDRFLGLAADKPTIDKEVLALCTLVETKTTETPEFWCRDPDDIKFLNLSNQHDISHLISKDLHLLKRKNRRKLKGAQMSFSIVTLESFLTSHNYLS